MYFSQQPRVKVPSELKPTPPHVLEEYVRLRISQYINLLTQRIGQYAPGLGKDVVDRAAAEALACLPPGDHGRLSLEDKQLQLVFRHDCLALGCLDPQCALCHHNPSRRCTLNFDRKYLVNDVLKARCGAGIRVELIDPNTGQPLMEEKLPEITLQISVLDGNLYDQKFLDNGKQYDGGMEPVEELDACALLQNKKKSTALLVCGSGGSNDAAGYVLLTMVDGKVPLHDLHVTDSSEAILSGRKPPFRLLVRALLPHNGPKLNIRHAVSEGFVVATRRTRTAGKADIPSVDDPVSKLEHMGKETVKKLADLAAAAEQAGVEIDIPENCVQKVGEFKMLALRADQDGHLRQKLQHVLKLSKEKWDEARDHAMRAVVADNRMRAWYADRRSCELGVLFTARLGNVDLERPVALLQTKLEAGERKTEAILVAQLSPAQRDTLRHMQPQAVAAWWAPGHPGWAIFPMDSDAFLQTGTLTPGAGPTPLGPPLSGAGAGPNALSDAPPSPTQSGAVSMGTTSGGGGTSTMTLTRRHTGGGGGPGGGINGPSLSSDMLLPGDASFLGKPLPPAAPSAPVTLPSSVPLPSAFGGGGLPTVFAAPSLGGSGRSSRAGSMTDSPPPSQRSASLLPPERPSQAQPPQQQAPQQQQQQHLGALSNHHSLPQPPSSHLQQHPSLQGHPSIQVHPSLQGHPGHPVHPGLQGDPSTHSGLQRHPSHHGDLGGLQRHPSQQGDLGGLQRHPSQQGDLGGLQRHASLQGHPVMQGHPGMQHGLPSGIGPPGPYGQPPTPPQASTGPNSGGLVDSDGGGGTPTAGMGQPPPSQHQQQQGPPQGGPPHHMMAPPPMPLGGGSRTMMLPPQGPPPSYRMPPPPHMQHPAYRSSQPHPADMYQAGSPMHGGYPPHPHMHPMQHTHPMHHGMGAPVHHHPGHYPPMQGGPVHHPGHHPHSMMRAASGEAQHMQQGMMRAASGDPQLLQQGMPPGPRMGPGVGSEGGGGMGHPGPGGGGLGPGSAFGRMPHHPPPSFGAPSPQQQQGPLEQPTRESPHRPRPSATGGSDESYDLPSRGSANPRPHKMPSLGRHMPESYVPGPSPQDASQGAPMQEPARGSPSLGGPSGGLPPFKRETDSPSSMGGGGGGVGGSTSAGGMVPGQLSEGAMGPPGSGIVRPNMPPPSFSIGALPGAPSAGPPRAAPPLPGQSPPGASPPPPGPPPNPFARVQSGRVPSGVPAVGPSGESDSDTDDPLAALAALPSLPLSHSMFQALAGSGGGGATPGGHPSGGTARHSGGPNAAGGPPAGAGAANQQHPGGAGGAGAAGAGGPGQGGAHGGPGGAQGGAGPGAAAGGHGGASGGPSGLNAPLPSLNMIDSQQLDMVLGDNLMNETSSLTAGLSYGLFLPANMNVAEGGMLPTAPSKELLRPTSSGLDTMSSIELALPGVRGGNGHNGNGNKEQQALHHAPPMNGGNAPYGGHLGSPPGAAQRVVAGQGMGPYAR